MGIGTHRGSGHLHSTRYRDNSDEIDLDRTLEVLSEVPLPEDDDIIVRERIIRKRSIILAVDVSGSMRGERFHTAAATVGALAGELRHDYLGVIAFWSDAAVLVRLGDTFKPTQVLDHLLRIPAQGLTNVSFPLEVAAAELARRAVPDSRVVLLSDCVHNAGRDPRGAAARLPRVDVMLDASGEKDEQLGREIAAAGRGRFLVIKGFRDVAPALTAFFER
ncbi:unannotated protein [freshwater metagenome]|uniref:Unannotated protein n=1 Tax=freshwater metagenome TaxID=449393 RepID=A0A6J7SAT1_9ZZZZ